jgi:hypothetical protein
MLHAIYDAPKEKLEESETVRILGDRDTIQLKFVDFLNNVALKGEPNYLRHPMVEEYLKWRCGENVYWIDNFTIMFDHYEWRAPSRAFATTLDYSIQFAMMMIYFSTIGVTDVVACYVPWVGDAGYISQHCKDMNLYVMSGGTFPFDKEKEREQVAEHTKGYFTFTFKGKTYTDISHFDLRCLRWDSKEDERDYEEYRKQYELYENG